MKRGLVICCAAALTLGVCNGIAAENDNPPVPDSPQALAEAENQFFVEHPDLKDEGEVVDEASKQLAAEGFVAKDVKDASETLAARARSLLADRTPAQWQRKAVSLFPALGVAGSEFNALFLKHYQELRTESPAFMEEPSWPVLLAQRCNDELRNGVQTPAAQPDRHAATAPGIQAQKALVAKTGSHPPMSRSKNFWLETFGISFSILFAVVPWAILYRKYQSQSFIRRSQPRKSQPRSSRPQPRPESHEVPAWKVAMRPAIVVFLIASLPAMIRTLMVNADLAMADRLAVGLVVGALFGLLITLPFYAMDALWHIYHKHHAMRHAGH